MFLEIVSTLGNGQQNVKKEEFDDIWFFIAFQEQLVIRVWILRDENEIWKRIPKCKQMFKLKGLLLYS